MPISNPPSKPFTDYIEDRQIFHVAKNIKLRIDDLSRVLRFVIDANARQRMQRELYCLRKLTDDLLEFAMAQVDKSKRVPIENYWSDQALEELDEE